MWRIRGSPAGRATEPTVRTLIPSVFLPVTIYEIGNGAAVPVLALTALDMDASTGTAGLILVLLGAGQIAADVPASYLCARIGDRRAMLVAACLSICAMAGCFLSQNLVQLGAAVLVIGGCNAICYVARQSYLTEVAPVALRARAMSSLGGAHRVGLFIGPFAGALAIGLGGLRSAYLVGVISASVMVVVLMTFASIEPLARATPVEAGRVSPLEILVKHRRLFATLGLAVVAVGGVRTARTTALPLWAAHSGLDAQTTSLVFGIAGAVEMLLFYPAGKMMDQLGRLSIAVPSMVLLGVAVLFLPLTGGVAAITAVAIVMAIGGGLGSGIMLTIAADAAPIEGRARFFGVWRLLADSGAAAGPAVLAAVTGLWTLATGIVTIGAIGLLAAAALGRWVPRYSAYATRSAVRAARATAASRREG